MWASIIEGLETKKLSKILFNLYLYLRKIIFSIIIITMNGLTEI